MQKISLLLFWISGLVTLALFSPLAFAGSLPYEGYSSLESAGEDLYDDHFEAAYWMKEWGIFSGYEDGTFGGELEINRAELAKVLVLSSGVTEEDVEAAVSTYDAEHGTNDYFWDVDRTAWYMPYVRYAQIQGWVSGYPDGSYQPSNSVLHPEAFKMIVESQYGTPDDAYAGENWYDLYFNFLKESDVLYVYDPTSSWYQSIFYTYTEEAISDYTIDNDSSRADIAELLYRLRVITERENFSVFNSLWTLDDYAEAYDATLETSAEGILTLEDPHFGFSVGQIPLGTLESDDLRILIRDPSGFENGWFTTWSLLYPTWDSSYDRLNYDALFTITLSDLTYTPHTETLSIECTQTRPFDLWDIYEAACGQTSEEAEQVADRLQFMAYVETAESRSDLHYPTESPLELLEFTALAGEMAETTYYTFSDLGDGYSLSALDYGLEDSETRDYFLWLLEKAEGQREALSSLLEIETVDPTIQSEVETWLEGHLAVADTYLGKFEDLLENSDEKETFYETDSDLYHSYSALEDILVEAEKAFLLEGSETFVFDMYIRESSASEYGYFYYQDDFEIVEGDISEEVWEFFGLLGGGDVAEEGTWIRVTVENQPLLEDEVQEYPVFFTEVGNNFYLFPILDVQTL